MGEVGATLAYERMKRKREEPKKTEVKPTEEPSKWHKPEGGAEEYYVTPKEFQEKYGTEPLKIPETAKITYMRKTKEGYEIQYYTPREAPKTVTDWLGRLVRGTDVPIVGGPVGGVLGVEPLRYQVKTWEATVGEVEEHVLKKPTPRSELMTHEELLISHGLMLGTVVAVKGIPKVWAKIRGPRLPSVEKAMVWETPIEKYVEPGASFKFWTQVTERPLPTPTGKAPMQLTMLRGKPTTPFATTLAKTFLTSKKGMAGLIQRQRLRPTQVVEPLRAMSFPIKRMVSPKLLEPSLGLGLLFLPRQAQTLRSMQVTVQKQALKLEQAQTLRVEQTQALKLERGLIQELITLPPLEPITIQTFKPPTFPRLPREPRRDRRQRRGLRGAWHLKTHPIKTHAEMRSLFFGEKPRRRKKAKKKKRRRKRRR